MLGQGVLQPVLVSDTAVRLHSATFSCLNRRCHSVRTQHAVPPVSVGFHVLQGGEHGLHPEGTGADVRGVGEVVVTECLLKLTQHLLEVGKVVVSLWRSEQLRDSQHMSSGGSFVN